MALMGAFYWAIRGTGGYGGSTGGLLAGFGWGLLWYGFSFALPSGDKRPYSTPWIILAIALGIAYGGATGYGVYISWIKGKFQYAHGMETRAVAPWTGYAMLFLCGLHWGGNTGCFMAWCAPSRPLSRKGWMARIASGLVGALLASLFGRIFPSLFLPFYREGIYGNEEYDICIRALNSIQNILPHVGTFLGFLAFEWARKDRRAVKMILTLALGFAIPFAVGGIWHTFYDSPLQLEWWKNWEMSIGFGGGLSLGLAFLWFNRPGSVARPASWGRAFFRTGLPFWLPVHTIVRNCWSGWTEMRSIDITAFHEVVLFLLSVAITWGLLWADPFRKRGRSKEFRISTRTIAGFQLIIVLAGWLVTIPLEWHTAHKILASLYVFYHTVSAALLVAFGRNQRL